MDGDALPPAARYDWLGWSVDAAPVEVAAGRLAETHEHFHRRLDDTTAFGGLMTTVAALADASPSAKWVTERDRLKAMSDVVHESFAVGMSLLTTQQRVQPIPDYPAYDRYVRTLVRLIGIDTHPWVALAALRAAGTACMQSAALAYAADAGIDRFDAVTLPRLERPNHRLAALLAAGFSDYVTTAQRASEAEHSNEEWWRPHGTLRLPPEAVDGAAAESQSDLHQGLLAHAERILRSAGGSVVSEPSHHAALRALLSQAQALAPDGLVRIGALVEAPGGDVTRGGALDSQTIKLTAAPDRAVVLPFGAASGLSGNGDDAHAFVILTRPDRIRRAFARVEGAELPSTPSAAFLRSTVFNRERRDCVLHVGVDRPEQLDDRPPVYVAVLSSAQASDPPTAAKWMRGVDPARVSLVMDTPCTEALRRWCADGAQFRTQTRVIRVESMEVRIIAGRVEHGDRRSALVIIPTTEFGARWFEAACAEDPLLGAAVQEDDTFFEQQGRHIDVVLNHLLYEERFVGTGSWRR